CYRVEDLGMHRYFAAALPDEGDLAAVASATDRPVGRRELAARTKMPPLRLAELLNRLGAVRGRPLRRPGQTGGEPPGPARAGAAAGPAGPARHHRSVERSRVEMMRRYAEMTDCRRRFLLRYFGEAVTDACHHCDNCDAGRSRPSVPAGAFSPGERVEHHDWGPGLVLAAEGDPLTLPLDEY